MSGCLTMDKSIEEGLILHCLEKMTSKAKLREIAIERGVKVKVSMTISDLAKCIFRGGISLPEITKVFRAKYGVQRIDVLKAAMLSGKLKGHDWHGARPSTMHMQFQDRVRECIAGRLTLDSLLKIGTDIARQEFFIVAQHDIVAAAIIQAFSSVIPEIGQRSVTDFVFNGVPVDLKVSTYPAAWGNVAGNMSSDDKRQFAIDFFCNADIERMRKQAAGARYTWGLNRMYVLIKDPDAWFVDPDQMICRLINQMKISADPFHIAANGFEMDCFVFEI